MDSFQKSYKATLESAGAAHGIIDGDNYVNSVNNAIDTTIAKLNEIGSTNKDVHYIKGDIAEPWHEGTAKIYSIAKGIDDVSIKAPRDNSPFDIVGMSPTEFLQAQLKYYKTAEDTAKAISRPDYFGLAKIVPSDQLEAVKEAAYQLYLKNLDTRPEVASQYLHTYEIVSDRWRLGGTESTPLSEPDALKIVKAIQRNDFDPEQFGLTSESFIQWSDIVRESGEAALNAAVLTAVLKAAPHLSHVIGDLIREGKLNSEKLKHAGLASIGGVTEGALRGGIAAAVTASCKAGLLGESLKTINPVAVGAATVVAMNAVHNAIGMYHGELTPAQFGEACLRDTFVVGCGVWGATVGQSFIPIPILGALIGNFVGSTVATVVYEGSKQIFISFFIHSDISFLNIVRQDYTLPRDVLEQCGFELIDLELLQLETLELETLQLETLELETPDIKVLKRGLISVNTIGYIQ